MRKLICKNCGKEFIQNGRGRARNYCYECESKNIQAELKQYVDKKQKNNNMQKENNYETVKENVKTNSKYYFDRTKFKRVEVKQDNNCTADKDNNVIYETDVLVDTGYGDIIQIARDYGACRFRLIEMIKKIDSEISEKAKIEQDLLHKLEFIEKLTDKEAQEIAVALKKNRESRRGTKNLQFLTKSLLDKMILRSPEKFVRQGIQMIKEQKYTAKALEELFKDDEENEQIVE